MLRFLNALGGIRSVDETNHSSTERMELRMTLTASISRRAIACLLAALLLATALAALMPTRTELPGMLDAFEVTSAGAHDKQECNYYTVTVYPNGRNGPGAYQETRRRCYSVSHSHPVRGIISGIGAGLACGVLASGLGPGAAFAAGAACGGAVGGAMS